MIHGRIPSLRATATRAFPAPSARVCGDRIAAIPDHVAPRERRLRPRESAAFQILLSWTSLDAIQGREISIFSSLRSYGRGFDSPSPPHKPLKTSSLPHGNVAKHKAHVMELPGN